MAAGIIIENALSKTQGQTATRTKSAQDQILASLSIALAAMGKPTSVNDLMATALLASDPGLLAAVPLLQKIGYQSKVVSLSNQSIVDLPTPFLLMTEKTGRVYTVLHLHNGTLRLFDAELGNTIAKPVDQFPGEAAQVLILKRAKKSEKMWDNFIIHRIKGVLGQIIYASVLVNLFQLCTPLISMVIFNKVLGHEAYSTLDVLVFGAVILYMFDTAVRIARGYISIHTGAQLDAQLGSEVMAHLLRLPLRHFEKTPSGVTTERLLQMDTIRSFLTGQMPLLLVDLVFAFVLLAALFIIDWRIGLFTTAMMPLFFGTSLLFDKAQQKFSTQSFAAQADKMSSVSEVTGNALCIKSLGIESEMECRHGEHLAQATFTTFQAQKLANAINCFGNLLLALSGLITLYLGALFVMNGSLSIGGLIAANMLGSRVLAPIRQVVSAWHQLRETQNAFERLNSIMDEQMEGGNEKISHPHIYGDIIAEDVSFTHDENGKKIIRNMSIKIPSGAITCVMGPSGGGKSTFGKLLMGIYQPTEGRISIGGTDIKQISPISLRRAIGCVPQENQLFAGTIRDNILMGAKNKNPNRAEIAAKSAGAHDFIQELENGYETVLTEGGNGLSSGQRQMLCIARALARDSRILIFDEATSALDLQSEEQFLIKIRQAVKTLSLTIIFITHRVAPLKYCDKLILIKNGVIEASGTAEEVAAHLNKQALPVPVVKQ